MAKKVEVGQRYETRGGWIAFIYSNLDGTNPVGWCKDPISGKEEPQMGIWDKNTGKCLKRGSDYNEDVTRPYDIINL